LPFFLIVIMPEQHAAHLFHPPPLPHYKTNKAQSDILSSSYLQTKEVGSSLADHRPRGSRHQMPWPEQARNNVCDKIAAITSVGQLILVICP
jgi:hypothetical protein